MRAAQLLRGLVAASHPFPVAMVVSLTALLAVVSADGVDAGTLALIALAMLFSQLAIGWSNDYLDRESDVVHQADKPIARGWVDPSTLVRGTLAALVASGAAGVALGGYALGLLVLGTSMGFAYNFWLKDTRLSWLPYVAAFAVLPPFVWVAVDAFRVEYWALYPIAAPLVVAVHIANALPDVETDRLAGRRGLVARLGRARSVFLLAACLTLPLIGIAFSALWLAYEVLVLALVVAAYSLLASAAVVVYTLRPDSASADVGFRLVAAAAVILAVGWLAAVRTG